MNIKTLTAAVLAAGCVFGAVADEQKAVPATADTKSANRMEVEQDDNPLDNLVSAEFHIGMDSRYMTYGMIDGKDPIIVPGAQITFFDWVYFGVESIFDVTKGNGKRGGYGAGRRSTPSSASRTSSSSARRRASSPWTSTTCTSTSSATTATWATRSTSTSSSAFPTASSGWSRRSRSSAT